MKPHQRPCGHAQRATPPTTVFCGTRYANLSFSITPTKGVVPKNYPFSINYLLYNDPDLCFFKDYTSVTPVKEGIVIILYCDRLKFNHDLTLNLKSLPNAFKLFISCSGYMLFNPLNRVNASGRLAHHCSCETTTSHRADLKSISF